MINNEIFLMEETIGFTGKLYKIYALLLIVIAAGCMALMLNYASKKVVFFTAEEAQAQEEAKQNKGLTKSVNIDKSYILEVRSTDTKNEINVSLPSLLASKAEVSSRPDLKKISVMLDEDKTEYFLNNAPTGDFENIKEVIVSYDGEKTRLEFETSKAINPVVSTHGNVLNIALEDFSKKRPVIVIDPGYGGSQPGTVAGSTAEKDITLRLAKLVAEKCKDKDYSVLLTRTCDETVLTEERLEIVDIMGADYYIALTLDSNVEDTKDFGMSAVYNSHYYRNGYENVDFADVVLRSCAESSVNKAKGLMEADSDDVILMALKIPAVRLNAGTITNLTEAQLLLKDEYLDRIATGITDAVEVAIKR